MPLAASRAEDQRWTRAQSRGQGPGPCWDFRTASGVREHHLLRRPRVRAGSGGLQGRASGARAHDCTRAAHSVTHVTA